MSRAAGYRLPTTRKRAKSEAGGKREAGSGKRLLITNIGELVTNPGPPGDLGLITDALVVVEDGRVVWVGSRSDLPGGSGSDDVLDAEGGAVLPGFVDAHTHLVFAGDRADEFTRRLRGESYEEILASGGGIHATVAATRAAAFDDLVASATARARRMLRSGTTTVEVKSGYGLEAMAEVRMLAAALAAGEATGISVVATFLAHVPPKGSDRSDYVSRVIRDMLPGAATYARYCDVFCDRGAFTVADARRILTAAAKHGMRSRLHAEQLSHTGAAALAAELGAASADHLDHATPDDAAALGTAGVVAVLLPGVSFSMRLPQPPARMLWDAGVTVAIATDCNPGTSNVESMSLMVALACLQAGLTPEESVWAATRGGALALELSDRGSIVPGAVADLVVLDAPSYRHIPYRPGTNLVRTVVKAGRVV